jgi:hypothetical protein
MPFLRLFVLRVFVLCTPTALTSLAQVPQASPEDLTAIQLSEPACVRCRFTAADEKMARDLYERGITLAQLWRAIWLGCARKYTTLLSSQAAAMPIASLSYFAAVIDEVVDQSNTSDAYWSYVRRKASALEQEWLSRFRSRTGSARG